MRLIARIKVPKLDLSPHPGLAASPLSPLMFLATSTSRTNCTRCERFGRRTTNEVFPEMCAASEQARSPARRCSCQVIFAGIRKREPEQISNPRGLGHDHLPSTRSIQPDTQAATSEKLGALGFLPTQALEWHLCPSAETAMKICFARHGGQGSGDASPVAAMVHCVGTENTPQAVRLRNRSWTTSTQTAVRLEQHCALARVAAARSPWRG
jgi:hypothetical protein